MATRHGAHSHRVNVYSNPRVWFRDQSGSSWIATGKKGKADAARWMTEVRFVIAALGDELEACGCTIEKGFGYYGHDIDIGGTGRWKSTIVKNQKACAKLSL